MSAEQIPRYVLDASIATEWFLNDEEHAAQADALLQSFREGHLNLIAPDHIRYEVSNAIRNAVRTGRISEQEGIETATEFLAWNIPVVADNDIILAGLDLALQYDCALYDGVYLAVAEMLQVKLIYADRRLRNSLGGRFSLAT